MARFFHNTLRIPHIQNATEKVRLVRFFLRLFACGCLLLQSAVISVALSVRLRLGFPVECSGFPEKVYAPVYTLLALACALWLLLLYSLFRIRSLRISGHVKGKCSAYLALNVLQFFVILVSRLHSSGYSNRSLLQNYGHVFTGGCLTKIQLNEYCCGFENYTEWLATRNQPNVISMELSADEISNREHVDTNSRGMDRSGKFVFPSSCQCSVRVSAPCVSILYKSVPSHRMGYSSTVPNTAQPYGQNTSKDSSFGDSKSDGTWNVSETNVAETNVDESPPISPVITSSIIATTADLTMLSSTTSDGAPRPHPHEHSDLFTTPTGHAHHGSDLFATPTEHAHIYSEPCIDSLVDHFKTVDISAAATAVVSSSISLAAFFFGYVLVHNLEGTFTVSDVYSVAIANSRRDNSISLSVRGDDPLSVFEQRDDDSFISLGTNADKRNPCPNFSHFQVFAVPGKHSEVPLDERDIHTSIPN